MAALVYVVLMVTMVGGSDAAWCVCRSDVSDSALQKTLDYACGAGADCTPIQQNGACYNPNTVRAHCSFATNSYYQSKGQAQGACDFSSTAIATNTDPSYTGCSYPATPSAAGTSSAPITGATPSNFTPNGVGGLGPSSGISNDSSDGGFLPSVGIASALLAIIFSWMSLLR